MVVKFILAQRRRKELKDLLDPLIQRGAEQIADACNAESSWGGYHADTDTPGIARVWADSKASVDAARSQRLIRNLDRGRP